MPTAAPDPFLREDTWLVLLALSLALTPQVRVTL